MCLFQLFIYSKYEVADKKGSCSILEVIFFIGIRSITASDLNSYLRAIFWQCCNLTYN